MSRLNKDMDYAGMNALSKAKMIAIDKGQSEMSPEMIAQAIMATAPNIVTETLTNLGADVGKISSKIELEIAANLTSRIVKTANASVFSVPKSSASISIIGKRAKDIRDNMRHTRLGVHHIILAIIQSSPAIKNIFLQEGIIPQKLLDALSSATKDSLGADHSFLPKKSPKSSGAAAPMLEPAGGIKKNVTPKKVGDVLTKYAVDLTALAQAKKLNPVIGRETEIARVFTVLCRKIKNNALLIGEHGVGKTAIVEGIAQCIADGKAPAKMANKRVFMLDMASIVAGTQYRGQFEERLKAVMEAFEQSNGEYIAFIDEIHTLMGAGSAVGTMDAANILKPSLARGTFRCIGSTTEDEYKKFFKKDGALDRRFQFVGVNEPTKEETISILNGLRPSLEIFHECTISDDAVKTAVEYADLHMAERHFPDKAIDVLDEMCSTFSGKKETLTKEHVAKTVSVLTQIPLDVITHSEYEQVVRIEEAMKKEVFGQEKALHSVSQSLKRAYSGLRDKKKPLASLMFAGPTGVGKTYVAEELAKFIFGSENALVKLNMTEFSEKHTVTRLIGSPPSYVGYGERNQFVDRIIRNPHSLILLDEIEKAHEDVVKIFMDVLLNGIITDGEGRKINFRNSIIIMTTNIGFSEGLSTSSLGFGIEGSKEEYDKRKDRIVSLCSKQFGMEFSNRIDEIVVFSELNDEDLAKVANFSLDVLTERIKASGVSLKLDKGIGEKVVVLSREEHGQNASRIKRFIRNKIEPAISEAIMHGGFSKKDIRLTITKDNSIKVVQK